MQVTRARYAADAAPWLTHSVVTVGNFDGVHRGHGKVNKENPDLGVKNYMLPIYHQKLHFKGATSLQLQSDPSVKISDFELRNQL